jgi:2-iminobutanoate/2-iminopropanoate deaminase
MPSALAQAISSHAADDSFLAGAPMSRHVISTPDAPAAIGPYSQAIRAGSTVYLSGQIALDPVSGQLVEGPFEAQVHRAFQNLAAVAKAAGGSLNQCVKLTLFLTDLGQFPVVNQIMPQYIATPYPARSTVGVASLPRGAQFEVEAVMVLD